jgi:hypothetical protein
VTESPGLAIKAPESLRVLHARLLRDGGFQFDIARTKPPPEFRPPDWLISLTRFLADLTAGAFPVLRVVFWAGLGAAALLVVWLIVREIMGVRWAGRRKAKVGRSQPADWAPDPRRARALLENADRLAEQGRFDQAVRLILHRGIEDIDDRRPRLVRPALTARDIARLDAIPASVRDAFTEMAAIVEFSAFGGHAIGREAFARCRAAYESFAFPGAWG